MMHFDGYFSRWFHPSPTPSFSKPTPAASRRSDGSGVGLLQAMVQQYILEFFLVLLVASVPVAYYNVQQRKKYQVARKRRRKRYGDRYAPLWWTESWPVLFGLYDLCILGVLPFSAWKEKTRRSIRAWYEKRYLRRLTLMGILPLYIQDGGLDTRKKGELESDHPSKFPQYVQSKKRAYFEFLVPKARGFTIGSSKFAGQDMAYRVFVRRLFENRHGYRVCVSGELDGWETVCSDPPPDPDQPLEVGAESSVELMLPFKRDQVIQPGKGKDGQELTEFYEPDSCPLLETVRCPLVRIEAPHHERIRLDEWVYGVAQEVGLERVWKEGLLHSHVSTWIKECGLELPDHLVAARDLARLNNQRCP